MLTRLIRNIRSLSRNRIPAQLVIQMTNHCNARCPQCGMRATAGIPYIRTGTNGFIFRHSERSDFVDRVKALADRLAATPLRNFWISIDSALPEIHEKMRGLSGVVKGIEKALPIFHTAGLFPSANLGINRLVSGEATASLNLPDRLLK